MLRPFENREEIKMTTETGPSASIGGGQPIAARLQMPLTTPSPFRS